MIFARWIWSGNATAYLIVVGCNAKDVSGEVKGDVGGSIDGVLDHCLRGSLNVEDRRGNLSWCAVGLSLECNVAMSTMCWRSRSKATMVVRW